MTRINNTRITRTMLVALWTKVKKSQINTVLDALAGLEKHYLKKKEQHAKSKN